MYDVTLNCRYVWRAPFKVPDKVKKYGSLTLTYASQLHIAVVEIESETFIPSILDYVAVDDCGTVINPPIVEGQVYGATAHGIGAALLETCVYDAVGNMLTSTFSDYTPITAVNMPKVKYGQSRRLRPTATAAPKAWAKAAQPRSTRFRPRCRTPYSPKASSSAIPTTMPTACSALCRRKRFIEAKKDNVKIEKRRA